MRVALAFAVVGLCTVLGLRILGVVGTSDAFDGVERTLALVAVAAGGAFALFSLLGGRRQPPASPKNGPSF